MQESCLPVGLVEATVLATYERRGLFCFVNNIQPSAGVTLFPMDLLFPLLVDMEKKHWSSGVYSKRVGGQILFPSVKQAESTLALKMNTAY